MKDIFTDLYNKVLGFFQKQDETESNKNNAKDVAYNRLKLVLMQDRTNLTPLLLERMRGEMIEVLSKYVEMDKDALELNFEQEGDSMALMLSIPVLRAREEEEIQATIKAEDEAKKAKEEKENECSGCECEDCNDECDCEECKCDTCDVDKCAECDCEYKDAEMNCEECPKLPECECVEDICKDCDCEFKDTETDCEECPKATDCECKKEFDSQTVLDEELEEGCDCQDDEECACGNDVENSDSTEKKKKSKKDKKDKK